MIAIVVKYKLRLLWFNKLWPMRHTFITSWRQNNVFCFNLKSRKQILLTNENEFVQCNAFNIYCTLLIFKTNHWIIQKDHSRKLCNIRNTELLKIHKNAAISCVAVIWPTILWNTAWIHCLNLFYSWFFFSRKTKNRIAYLSFTKVLEN